MCTCVLPVSLFPSVPLSLSLFIPWLSFPPSVSLPPTQPMPTPFCPHSLTFPLRGPPPRSGTEPPSPNAQSSAVCRLPCLPLSHPLTELSLNSLTQGCISFPPGPSWPSARDVSRTCRRGPLLLPSSKPVGCQDRALHTEAQDFHTPGRASQQETKGQILKQSL